MGLAAQFARWGSGFLMSSKKRRAGQLPPGFIRKFRSDVAKLKDKGLVSARVDARAQKPTRYMKKQVEKFRDVIEGRAAVVNVPRADAKKFRDAFKTKGTHVVVPKVKGERVRYDRNSGTIYGYATQYGERYKRARLGTVESAADLPQGPGVRYTLPLSGGQQMVTMDDPVQFFNFVSPYETGPRPYKDIWRYVIVEFPDGRRSNYGEEFDDGDF